MVSDSTKTEQKDRRNSDALVALIRATLEEIFPSTQQQSCWSHKTRNGLNALPKSVQHKATQVLHEIWRAETISYLAVLRGDHYFLS
jgi:transposase-like protein